MPTILDDMIQKAVLALIIVIALGLVPARASAQTEFPPAYDNQAHYRPGDLVTDYGNLYRCQVVVTKPYIDPSKNYTYWELFYVRNNTTIPIGLGQTFPTLTIAWNYVRNCRIALAAYLHLNIVTTGGAYNETYTASMSLNHNSGAQISIIGDDVSAIHLNFSFSHGFTIDTGHSFGTISKVSLVGASNNNGIYGTSSGSIANIDTVGISGFEYGVFAEGLANLNFGNNITVTNWNMSAATRTQEHALSSRVKFWA